MHWEPPRAMECSLSNGDHDVCRIPLERGWPNAVKADVSKWTSHQLLERLSRLRVRALPAGACAVSGSAAAAISLGVSSVDHPKERGSLSWLERCVSPKVTNQLVATLVS
jgi:hypothetical protein